MRAVTAPQLLGLKFEEPRDIVGGGLLGYQAFTVVSGAEGIGKSLFVLQMAWHIALGQAFLGFPVTTPQPVLLIQKELPPIEIQSRLQAQLGSQAAPESFRIVTDPWEARLHPFGLKTDIDALIEEHKPRVVILDPFVEFHNEDEDESVMVKRILLNPVKRWMAAGLSTVLVHHHSKPSGENPRAGTNRVRGSSAITGAADTNVQLIQDSKDEGRYHIEFAKLRRWAPQKEIMLAFDPERLTFSLGDVTVLILQAIRQFQPVTAAGLEAALEGSVGRRTVERHLHKLLEERVISATFQGNNPAKPRLYALAEVKGTVEEGVPENAIPPGGIGSCDTTSKNGENMSHDISPLESPS